jgi:TRAP-type mannitol/chloroaromatic compound transport system permease small subunit
VNRPATASRIDAINVLTGRVVAWLTLVMVLSTVVVVVLRYVFDIGQIWLQEAVTWMHGVVFMLGAAYTLQRDEHVRVDIFYRDLGPKGRGIVNCLGVLLFLAPTCVFLFLASLEYVSASWAIHEVSRDAGGLPYPLVPLSKSILLLMPIAVSLQGVSMLLVSIRQIRGS